jgi:hypothetical protein
MRIVKRIFIASILLLSLSSCERDEICLEDITPRLVVRFYNNNIPDEEKSVIGLKIHLEGIEGEYTDETLTQLTDSVMIPIRVDQDLTRIILTLSGDESAGIEDNPDTLEIGYTREDLFVSRSCGYKTIFHEGILKQIDDGDNWIQMAETVDEPQEIIDEKQAHVKVYH